MISSKATYAGAALRSQAQIDFCCITPKPSYKILPLRLRLHVQVHRHLVDGGRVELLDVSQDADVFERDKLMGRRLVLRAMRDGAAG